MATATPPQPQPCPGPETASPAFSVRRWLINVDEYHRLVEAGILALDARSELIEGEVFLSRPISNRHAACVRRLDDLFRERLDRRAVVSVQSPVRIGDHSEPEPDLALLRPRADHYYATGHPGPADVFLLIEVMVTSADYDRGIKLSLYARAGVAEVWLIDLPGERIEVDRRLFEDIYTENQIVSRGKGLAPEAFPELELGADAVLG